MHTMSFRVPADLPEPIAADLLRSSVAGGHDRAPTATQCEIRDGLLILAREINESGPAYIPWEVPRAGRLMTTTTTLMFRDRPYHLVAELARGKINQVRNQYADWLSGGLVASEDVEFHLELRNACIRQIALGRGFPRRRLTRRRRLGRRIRGRRGARACAIRNKYSGFAISGN